MMKLILLVVSAVAVVLADVASPSLKEFADGSTQFSSAVYQELLKSNSGNFLFCPLSVEIVLALAQAGAQGETAQEISQSLHLPDTKAKVQEAMVNILEELKSNDKYTLSSANRIFVKEGFQIKEEYNKIATDVFDSGLENINFAQKATAVKHINEWVEEQTAEKIKNLLQPDDIEELTRLVLVNALYFNGKWKYQFPDISTYKQPFYLSEKDTTDVDLMAVSDNFNYFDSSKLNAKILELPYEGDDIVFTIVLPNEKNGLETLEANAQNLFISPEYINVKVFVKIPKFAINTYVQFNDILKNIGVVTPFDEDKADFSGVSANGERLFISKVVQKAFINVTESGTEAAASTAVIQGIPISAVFPEPKYYDFIADHPFVFYIRHKKSGVTLFTGRITKPEIV